MDCDADADSARSLPAECEQANRDQGCQQGQVAAYCQQDDEGGSKDVDGDVEICGVLESEAHRQRVLATRAVGFDVRHLINEQDGRDPGADRKREQNQRRIDGGALQPGGTRDR